MELHKVVLLEQIGEVSESARFPLVCWHTMSHFDGWDNSTKCAKARMWDQVGWWLKKHVCYWLIGCKT